MRVRLKSILCATDLSDYGNTTVTYGVALAREFTAKLYLCHVIDEPSVALYGEASLNVIEKQNQIMDFVQSRFEEMIGEEKVNWEPLITIGKSADEITRMAGEKNADMVISATHGRSGIKRLILGSVTERLVRTLPCPLLTVRGGGTEPETAESALFRLKRILVGCDFSRDSELAFQYALSLAQEFEAELHLVHVVEPPIYLDLLKISIEQRRELQQELRANLRNRLDQMVPEDARHWCRPQASLLDGQPFGELSDYAASHDIDLIVLGVRGHTLTETLFVGSTTDRVLRRAACPVLSVRPKNLPL
ncbi:MAG: universal stress protein [Desulfobacterales bacterium]|nr:universal stress protein [Desulfobacterales bacterium]